MRMYEYKNQLELVYSMKHKNLLEIYYLQYKYLDNTTYAIYGRKQKSVPNTALPAFSFLSPKFTNDVFRKIHTNVIPNPAIPNSMPAEANNLGQSEMLPSLQ